MASERRGRWGAARWCRAAALAAALLGLGSGCASTRDRADRDLPVPTRVHRVEPAAGPTESAPAPLTRAELTRWLEGGPGRLLQHVQLDPERDERGRFRGYRIAALSPPLTADRTGLLIGDRLLAVNGKRLVQPGDLMEAWRRAARRAELTALVQRGGETVELQWPVQD